ncbi:hypothetical protein [Azospirillum argentinense]
MNKVMLIFLSLLAQLIVGMALMFAISLFDPGLLTGFLNENIRGAAISFALRDLRFDLTRVLVLNALLGAFGSLVWLLYACTKKVHHPREVPVLSIAWIIITLVFVFLAIVSGGYFVSSIYELKVNQKPLFFAIGFFVFLAFYYPATFFATRRTMRPSVLFRNRLFARSKA